MKKYFVTHYIKYERMMKDYYPYSTLNYESVEVKNVIGTIFKIIEVIKKVEKKHIKNIEKNTSELLYTLDNFLITLPIFRKKVVYLLLRNIVECTVNSWILSFYNDEFSSFRESKEFIKDKSIYNENKNIFDSLFQSYTEFSSIIHFNGSYHSHDFLSKRIELECKGEDWNKINSSLNFVLISLLLLLRKDENKFSTNYKILLQDVLSKNEYNIIVNTNIK
ncbi:hypothetical protein JTF04_02505 [Mammaliicoccus vitulinus]|uniref:hypothetical protein n=1 Tax=Mammaliicoccus vitulinus TaxID=71237 RepID=UPI00194E5800|nr:hypothetical protein [Mammaliicoccus vitulinus]MBM6628539.1 hypothetical protein [Mammaliicoccus vitulinus]